MFASLWRNRELILASARREILRRYRGSFMGLFWSVFTPLCMLAVYTFVFGEVFKARWGVENESKMQFALMLFAGLIVFNLFAECVNRGPTLVLAGYEEELSEYNFVYIQNNYSSVFIEKMIDSGSDLLLWSELGGSLKRKCKDSH